MIFLFAALAGIIVLFLSTISWRWSLKAVLVITVIEGGLRKWVLPQASEAIYFLKDGVLLGGYIGYCIENNLPTQLFNRFPGFTVLIGALAAICLLQTLNPLLGSVPVGLLGAKAYIFYLPMCLILPKLFGSIEHLCEYLQWFLLLCIPVGLLGVLQFFSPADSAINVYAPSAVEVAAATFGEDGNVRVTGTFPYIVGFSIYVVLCLAFDFALLAHLRGWGWRVLLLGMQLLLGTDLVMTGSRGAALSTAGLLAGFMVYSVFEKSRRSRGLAPWLLVTTLACAASVVLFFPGALKAFRERAEDSGDSLRERIVNGMVEPTAALDKGGVLGYGTGACQGACFALRDQLHLGPPTAYPPPAEGEPLRVILELGVVGFIGWYALRIYLLGRLWLLTRQLRHPVLRHLAVGAFLMHALFLTGQLVTNTTFSVFYWFLAGFVFLFPELDKKWLQGQQRATDKLRLRLQKAESIPLQG